MIEVVAGVLRDAQGRVLLAQRPPRGPHAGLWEFPGGKREPGESGADALRRELHEELGIEADPGGMLWRVPWSYPHVAVALEAIQVPAWRGVPHGREGQQLAWVAPEDLHRWPLPAADVPIAAALRLPRAYAITPDPGHDAERLLADAHGLLARGARLLQLRAKRLGVAALSQVLSALEPAVDARGRAGPVTRAGHGRGGAIDGVATGPGGAPAVAAVLVNGAAGLALAADHPWIGVHLTSADLVRVASRPAARPRWVAASCHDAAEIARAVAIDCDFVVVGPVLPTASHPGAPVLGWEGLARLCRDCPLPVYALGGVGPDHLDTARAHGAFGVAGIRAFQP